MNKDFEFKKLLIRKEEIEKDIERNMNKHIVPLEKKLNEIIEKINNL